MSAAGGTQTVLITGATDGLGKAAALLLAERGYRVFAAGRSADKRAQLDALAKEKHLLLETMQMDVCDDASVQKAVASVYQKAGALDRSEEHTSELQSQSNLVCRLLLD